MITANSDIQNSGSVGGDGHVPVTCNNASSDTNLIVHVQPQFNGVSVNGAVRAQEMDSFASNYLPASLVAEHHHHEFVNGSSSTNKENMIVDNKWIKSENVGARDAHRWEML